MQLWVLRWLSPAWALPEARGLSCLLMAHPASGTRCHTGGQWHMHCWSDILALATVCACHAPSWCMQGASTTVVSGWSNSTSGFMSVYYTRLECATCGHSKSWDWL